MWGTIDYAREMASGAYNRVPVGTRVTVVQS